MSSPRAPAPLDVGRVQNAQNEQNARNAADQARYNRINQYGPFGSVTYDPTSGAQTTSLNADEMAMRNRGRDAWAQAAGGLAGVAEQTPGTLARTLNDPEGLAAQGAGRLQSEFAGPGQDSNGAFDRAYEYASANLEPRMERQRAAMENRLRNQGLDPTSEAYRTASNDLALQQNEARNNLVTGLQGQMFNQGLQGRQQGFNESAGLMGLGMQRAGQAFGQDQAIAGVRNQGLGLQGDLYGRLGQMGLSGMGGAATSHGRCWVQLRQRRQRRRGGSVASQSSRPDGALQAADAAAERHDGRARRHRRLDPGGPDDGRRVARRLAWFTGARPVWRSRRRRLNR